MEAGKDTSFEEQEHECVIGGAVNGLNGSNISSVAPLGCLGRRSDKSEVRPTGAPVDNLGGQLPMVDRLPGVSPQLREGRGGGWCLLTPHLLGPSRAWPRRVDANPCCTDLAAGRARVQSVQRAPFKTVASCSSSPIPPLSAQLQPPHHHPQLPGDILHPAAIHHSPLPNTQFIPHTTP